MNLQLARLLRNALLAASLFALAATLFAQQPTPQQTPPNPPSAQQQPAAPKPQTPITVDVKSVNILATVRDKHGKIVSDLTKDAFQIDEDGKPQTIDYFAKESDIPLRLGLLVDTSFSQSRVLDQERDASQTFLEKLLRPDKDQAAVINFDYDITLLQDLTSSRPKLQAALQQLQIADRPQMNNPNGQGGQGGQSGQGGQGGQGSGQRGNGRRSAGGTHLYDAIYLASDEIMSKPQGRKALVVLSDGVDHGSKETLAEAIETAQRADTLVYSIYFADEQQNNGYHGFGTGGPYGGHGGYGGGGGRGGRPPQEERPDGKKILEQISRTTGGRLFEASKKDKDTVAKIYAEIEEELRNQYRLGYTPAKDLEAGYHKIHLTTSNKDLKIQTRDGYYSGVQSTPTALR
jgi:VWFA-related protein